VSIAAAHRHSETAAAATAAHTDLVSRPIADRLRVSGRTDVTRHDGRRFQCVGIGSQRIGYADSGGGLQESGALRVVFGGTTALADPPPETQPNDKVNGAVP
jgi:hypothetical protein